jgi:YD repeat-containing protein
LTVTAPHRVSVTLHTNQSNQLTVTDATGKWKTFTTDAMGNLVTVTEPDPVSGTVATTYTYNGANQFLTVTMMPRSNGTQTRSFQWTGSDLTSATNPENGTVTYTYDNAHRVLTRTDAKGQKTQYTYDLYGRKTLVQHFNAAGVEQLKQQVTYTYGDNAGAPTFSQNSWGRLASVAFSNETPGAPEGFSYLYSYDTAGSVTTQRMQVVTGTTSVNLDAAISVDSEGKLHSVTPPGDGTSAGIPKQYLYSYDPMGRLTGLTENSCQTPNQAGTSCTTYATNGPTVATAAYGPAGELTGLTYDGFTETRTYNSLLQLTRMTATSAGQTVMDYLSVAKPDAVHVFEVAEQRADHAIDGRDDRGRRDGGLHLRHAESPDEGGDDQRGVGRGLHLRRIREPDGEDADQGDGPVDDGVVRCGEPPGGADLRSQREYGIQRDVSV